MGALKKIALVLIGLLIVLLGVGAFLTKDYRVERSIEITASVEVVFSQVNSLKNWEPWSPWLANDSTIKNTFSGPAAGEGAKVSWTSEKSGGGTQLITQSVANSRIETALDFGDMGTATADWIFESQGDAVRVIWGLSGTAEGAMGGYFAKMMDGWVGKDYEQGLLRLKEHVENMPTATP